MDPLVLDLIKKIDSLTIKVNKQGLAITCLEDRLSSNENALEKMLHSESVVIVLDSCKELGDKIVEHLNKKMDKVNTKFVRFGNNETNTFPLESVRKKNVFIIGSGSNSGGSINDNFMTMCGMIRACRDASAADITLMCCLLPYSRSDKKDVPRSPIMSKLVCDFFKKAGCDRLISIDLHASQIQGFFDGPYDNLYAINYLIRRLKKDYADNNFIIVSPDIGGEKRATKWSEILSVPCTFLTKKRDLNTANKILEHKLVDQLDFNGKRVVLIDDMGDTLGTLNGAAKILKARGASEIICCVTHGVLSGNALNNLKEDLIDRIYVTNTIPQEENCKQSDKIRVVDLSKLCAASILSCVQGSSMSALFNETKG